MLKLTITILLLTLILSPNIASTPMIIEEIYEEEIISNVVLMSEYTILPTFTYNDGIYATDENMSKLCKELLSETVEGTVLNTLNFVNTNYEYNLVNQINTNCAIDIYHGNVNEMICEEYTILSIALLRENGISCTKFIKWNNTAEDYHAFVGVWNISGTGEWSQWEPQTALEVDYFNDWD